MRAEEVIATHVNTDFDAFASLIAARCLYPSAVAVLPSVLNRNVREFARLHAEALRCVEPDRLELDAIRRLVVVETLQASRLGELEPVALDPAVETVVFDHHAGELPAWVRPENAVISTDGALTTTLVGILAEREVSVGPLEATVFALGIHEDTGSLTYSSSTLRDAEALAWCVRHGARPDVLAAFLRTPLDAEERALLNALLDAVETHRQAGVDVLLTAVSWPRYVDGISHLAHKITDVTDCQVLVMLVEMDRRVFCVVRSRVPDVDAGVAARALGGAGHPQAASAIFRGGLAEARARFLERLPQAMTRQLRARDVMAEPPRSIEPGETVASAMVACQRYGQSGILVTENGRLVGAVRREDLDRAIGHGLSHAPVKGIMSSRVPTVGEEASLAELQRLLAETGEGRIAVVRDDRVVGVVTRSDVLHALGEAVEAPVEPAETIAAELRRLERLAPVFETVAAASDTVDGVYLVGGTVRDILLGEEAFDVDIAVEGDAIGLARTLARQLGGRVRPHEKFGTAVVVYGDGQRIDVVTARTEFYDAPAALPAVEHASIRDDLFRRDFTINAMAASLKGADFGRLVDPFGGRRDLAAGRVRVLHNLSFIDDPTRIFRAIRYENRYGFRMDEHTARLARGCIEMGLVGDLSSERLRDELEALLEEGEVEHSVLRLAELGAASAIHPRLAADEEAVALIRRGRELAERYRLDLPAWRIGFAALARRMSSDEAYDWLMRLKTRRRDAERIAGAVTVGPRLAERLADETLTSAEVVALADPYAPDAPLFALALADVPALHRYFAELSKVRLEVNGSDLAALGLRESPRVGEVLAELRRRKLNGELDGRESELAAARELIAGAG
ncbi:MAG TPA: CBS domain-containing protein [Gaiellaceae bacterium]|nr:CBS domain-containing protein [Gaiellaceae bacterium]HZT52924.1 CBS domain-containing protein [Gaiellaceae bacterium]